MFEGPLLALEGGEGPILGLGGGEVGPILGLGGGEVGPILGLGGEGELRPAEPGITLVCTSTIINIKS